MPLSPQLTPDPVDRIHLHHPRPVSASVYVPRLPPTPSPVDEYLVLSPGPEIGADKVIEYNMERSHSLPGAQSTPPYTDDAPVYAPLQPHPAPMRPQIQTHLSEPGFFAIPPPLQFYSPGVASSMTHLATPWSSSNMPHTVSPQDFSPGIDPRMYPSQAGYMTPGGSSHSLHVPGAGESYFSMGESDDGMRLESNMSSPVKKMDRAIQPPRPPNAWILYRSDMLKAIAAGEKIPALDAIMQDNGPSSSSPSGGDSGNASESASTAKGKKKKISKPKKGSKEPSEAFVSTLGKGKTGRGIPQADISKMISQLWKRETAAVKEKYETMSKRRKEEHDKQYPEYKFQPMRKADKLRLREEKEREREEQKRMKELERSGGRASRRKGRRASPATPYSTTNALRPRIAGRALSYNGAGHAEEQKFSSYPFPIPLNNLPSMRSEEHAHAQYGTPLVPSVPSEHPAMRAPQVTHAPPTPQSTSRHVGVPSPAKGRGASETIRHVSNLGLPPPAERQRLASVGPEVPNFAHTQPTGGQQHVQAVLQEVQPGVFVPITEGWITNIPHVGPSYAFPATFHPIPLPADLDPHMAGEMGQIEDLSEEQALRALAAQPPMPDMLDPSLNPMWVELYPSGHESSDSAEGSVPMSASGSATGSFSGESSSSYGFTGLNMAGAEAAARWTSPMASEQLPLDQDEASRPGPRSHSGSISGPEGLESGGSQPSTYDYYARFIDPSVSFPDLRYEPAEPHRLMPAWAPGAGPSGLGLAEADEGPMLNAGPAPPMSPSDDWSRQTTPRNPLPGSMQQQQQAGQSRMASTFAARLASGNSSAPAARYVSHSAFPSQPLSVDAGALGMMGSDRIPSFAQFESSGTGAEPMAGDGGEEGDDLDWAVEEEMPTARPRMAGGGSEMQMKQDETSSSMGARHEAAEASMPVGAEDGGKTVPDRRGSAGANALRTAAGTRRKKQVARRYSESARAGQNKADM